MKHNKHHEKTFKSDGTSYVNENLPRPLSLSLSLASVLHCRRPGFLYSSPFGKARATRAIFSNAL
jgi:hypothetical protein